ncbi:Coenzyme F420 hydrogenase/dehydrogenase, beta subunit C-terminal domain [Candidatus Electronema sp. PJ]|uniref:Coenzyme F420 hydrogenase/dehydrogenase, beta subunit C-terminal domain n=1 Tax=Candidatus Electronema sp. PJ TaxID=3401572 RepID=UPI003AA8628C
MKKSFAQLREAVIKQELCTRCGICVGVCPVGALSLDEQCFPQLSGRCAACGLCAECCPGADVDLPALALDLSGQVYDWRNLTGYVENTYVAHALDEKTRAAGASGGVVTALLLYLLKKGQIDGAVIVAPEPGDPCLTRGILATTPEEIRNAAQSKYCVTPSMEMLREVRARQGKFAVVALPCQIHGLRKLAKADPALFSKIELILGLYCTCTMNPEGHLEALQAAGIRREEVARFHFRGPGWPGGMSAEKKDGSLVLLHAGEAFRTTINTMFRLFGAKRCFLCVDGQAELADLSFGDFWACDYTDEFKELERCTLVSQRTAKGLRLLQEAEQEGVLALHHLPADRVSKRGMSMVRGKRSRTAVHVALRRKKGLPLPDYHITIPEPTQADWKKNLTYLLINFFRDRKSRSILLWLLFSPRIGLLLHKLNALRLRISARYHNN